MRPARRGLPLLLCLLAAILSCGPAAADSDVYTPRNRAASELLPVVASALGEGVSVTLDAATNSIVLVGSEADLLAARALLERLDVLRRSVTVRVESRSSRALRGAGYRVEWTQPPGPLVLGRLVGDELDELPAAPAPGEPRGRRYSTARDDRLSTSLRILDGEVGRIETGRSVVVQDRRLFGFFAGTTRIVEVRSGLLAAPRVLGDDRVQLELAPYEGDVDPAARTRFMEAATTVVVRAGEVILLGTQTSRGTASGRDAFSQRSRKESIDDRILLLSVEID